MEKTKENGRLNGPQVMRTLPRVEDAIAGSYKSASRTFVAQIQSRIKARKCAANLVMLVKFSG